MMEKNGIGRGLAGPQVLRETVSPLSVGLTGFGIVIFLSALESYAFLGIPLQWLGYVAAIIVATFVILVFKVRLMPGSTLFLGLCLWMAIVTFLSATLTDYSGRMPIVSSTPYPVFIGLRFLKLFSFFALAQLVYALCVFGREDAVIRITIGVSIVIATYSFYVYAAARFNLPEVPRLQIGTGGTETSQLATFRVFMRSIGTFREPGPFAVWLVVPLFLCFMLRRPRRWLSVLILVTAFVATGSLTGILATAIGIMGAILLFNPFHISSLRVWTPLVAILALGFLILNYLVPVGEANVSVIHWFWSRTEPLLQYGLAGSNRDYTWEYVISHPVPLLGSGLGHVNLDFSQGLLSSLLSLYFNTWLAGGIVGIFLLTGFLSVPLILFVANGAWRHQASFGLLAAYVAWLAAYAVQPEEFQQMFAVIFALLVYRAGSPLVSQGRTV